MRVLISGATGFIGSYVLRELLASPHQILALRRPGSIPKIEIGRDPEWVEISGELPKDSSLPDHDVIIHLAAAGVSPKPSTWEMCFEFNVLYSLRLLEACIEKGANRAVIGGTYSEYGLSGLRYPLIPPDAPLEPMDPYAASKAAFSIAACGLCRKKQFELSYQRIFSVYGEGQYEKNFWPAIRKAALSGEDFKMTLGEQIRDFISVEEVAKKIVYEALGQKLEAGVPRVANLASGQPVRLADFAQKCWSDFNATGNLCLGDIDYREDEVMRYIPEV